MTYDEFLEGINNPDKIKQIDFYIEGYNHYRNCDIEGGAPYAHSYFERQPQGQKQHHSADN